MQYILHIDTSTDSGVVAISADGKILDSRINEESRNHAGTVNLMIDEILKSTGLMMNELDAIAVCAGPGSYTGLRIGLATAKGICYALDKPLILNNRLLLLAYQWYCEYAQLYDRYTVILVARTREYFVAEYDSHFKCIQEPCHSDEERLPVMKPDALKRLVITDAGDNLFEQLEKGVFRVEKDLKIDLSAWASRAFEDFKCHNIEILSTSEPFYLKQVYTHK